MRSAWMNCSSLISRQMPVSGSGVRLGVKLTPQGPVQAVLVPSMPPTQGSGSAPGASITKSCGWPESARVMSGSGPFAPMIQGVWQSWHPEVSTRYLPMATGSSCAKAAPGTTSASAAAPHRVSKRHCFRPSPVVCA